MAIDFPNSPTTSQVFTSGNRSWIWNGSTWDITPVTVTGPTGPTGAQGAASTVTGPTGARGGVDYVFSTTTTDADPGNGIFRYNNATLASVTFIYIDNLDNLGNTQTTWYDLWDDSTDTVKGFITIQGTSGSVVNQFRITGNVTVATGYYKIPVAFVSGAALPTNSAPNIVSFTRTGNVGANGTSGSNGDRGGVRYTWSSTTTNTDPGNGFIRYNNATMTNVTQIYVDNIDGSGTTVTGWYDSWATPTSQNKGYLIVNGNTGLNFTNVFLVTGDPVSQSGTHYLIPVQWLAGTVPANNNVVVVEFSSVGFQGPTGPTGASGGPTGPTGPSGTANYEDDQAVLAQRIFT